jgi:uncharacterized integral membrane protein
MRLIGMSDSSSQGQPKASHEGRAILALFAIEGLLILLLESAHAMHNTAAVVLVYFVPVIGISIWWLNKH